MSKFDQPEDVTEAHDAEDLCPDCRQTHNACTCDPEVCLFCNRIMPDREFYPYCTSWCASRAEQFECARADARRI